MQFGVDEISVTPFGMGQAPYEGVLSPFYTIFQRDDPIVVLMEVTPYDLVTDQEITLKYQWTDDSREWRGTSAPGGTDLYLVRLLQTLSFTRQSFGDDVLVGTAQDSISVGQIRINLDPADSDAFAHYEWSGAIITLKLGEHSYGLNEFEPIFTGHIERVEWDVNKLVLQLTDPDDFLMENIQLNLYTGEGEEEGFEELKDIEKPLAYGLCEHAEPVLIDNVWQVYQWVDGPMEEIVRIYDGGVDYGANSGDIDDGDIAGTPVDLWAWASSGLGGQWITHRSQGLMRLGAKPFFKLTGDIKGWNGSPKGYSDRFARIAEQILVQKGGLQAEDIEGVAALDALAPYASGLYLRQSSDSVGAVLTGHLSPLLAFPVFSRRGDLLLRQIRTGNVAATYEEHNIPRIKRLLSSPIPVKRLRFAYAKNWTIQENSELAKSITSEEADPVEAGYAEFANEEYRFVSGLLSPNSAIARELDRFSTLINSDDAQLEADRQVELVYDADVYEIQISRKLLRLLPGDTVRIKHPRFELTGPGGVGKGGIVLSVRENARTQITTIHWITGNPSS